MALPGLSGGRPTALTEPTLPLLFVLTNSLLSEMLCVWKFFSSLCSDFLKGGPCSNKHLRSQICFLQLGEKSVSVVPPTLIPPANTLGNVCCQ